MLPATKAISLVLIGSAAALLGYEAVAPSSYNNGGADFGGYFATTQPNGGGGRTFSHYSNGYYYYYNHGSGYSRSSSSGWHGLFSSHGGTSRGGFGSSGHAAGS